MTYAEAIEKLESLEKFYEENKQHLLLGVVRQALEDAKKEDPQAEANEAVSSVVTHLGTTDMMDKFVRPEEEKQEDTCDWTTNGSNNNFYSMRDVPTAESSKTKFRALCEEEIKKFQEDDNRNSRLIKAVMSSCNCDANDAWENILGARQSLEDNVATDPGRSMEYLRWALEDLGLEMDYAEDFLTNVPYETYSPDEDDEKTDVELTDFLG